MCLLNVIWTNFVIKGLSCCWGGKSPAFYGGGQGSIAGESVWDLGWTEWRWHRFFPCHCYSISVACLFFFTRRTNGRSMESSQKNSVLLDIGEHWFETWLCSLCVCVFFCEESVLFLYYQLTALVLLVAFAATCFGLESRPSSGSYETFPLIHGVWQLIYT